ncbi:MAG: tetratricopeptide repeat protein [Methylococcales bacterium]|nr:tetratricopeptide repeat protein [Methylococcales bacterium]
MDKYTAVNEHNSVFEQALHAATLGNQEAEFDVGLMYLTGDGIAKDAPQALTWLLKAANHDVTDAQYNAALMYLTGDGIAADTEQAFVWMTKAALNNAVDAQYNLGLMYDKAHEADKSFTWLAKAAALDHQQAQYHLGRMYLKGYGTEVNLVQALKWLSKAAEQGSLEAQAVIDFEFTDPDTVFMA